MVTDYSNSIVPFLNLNNFGAMDNTQQPRILLFKMQGCYQSVLSHRSVQHKNQLSEYDKEGLNSILLITNSTVSTHPDPARILDFHRTHTDSQFLSHQIRDYVKDSVNE